MSNEDIIEEMLVKAYQKGHGKAVISMAAQLEKSGTERFLAFTTAYTEIVKKNEIHRERHPGSSETGDDGKKGS